MAPNDGSPESGGPAVQQLRREIISSQCARTEFLKWKLGLIAALAAVGMGITG